ncbi:alpha/beta fold hydrolase [Cupriavidus sp. CuC1]|uniref:alpha/beta fold hydrolase n=1 Tax=Cupriavidus sp. CuC1 TaxID=3373131 RepID=UPI0037CDEBA2
MVGHSIGGGEIARYVSRHGGGRVAKVILIGSVAPTTAGVPMEIFDGIRKALADNRGQFFKDLAGPFLGINRPNASVPQGTVDAFWLQGMSGGIVGQIDCIRAFSEVDYTGDMKRISVPTLILHGDDDQNVPIEISAQQSVKLIPNATLKVYPGGSHGIVMTHVHEINADILGFLKT